MLSKGSSLHTTLHVLIRAAIIGTIALLLVFIGLHAYIDWTGNQRWSAAQQLISKEGESLDFHAIAPAPVPDDQNFFAIPALKGLPLIPAKKDDKTPLGRQRTRLINAALPSPSPGNESTKPSLLQGATLGQPTNLKAWAGYLRRAGPQPAPATTENPASDILASLSRNDALVSELAQGISRPESQWVPSWKTRTLPEDLFTLAVPQYMVPEALTPMLCLRSTAAAAAGDAQKAHQSLIIAIRLNQADLQEPNLIGTLVSCKAFSFVCSAVWELCNTHIGTDEEFKTLQQALAKSDFRQSLLYALRGELVGDVNIANFLKRKRDPDIISAAAGIAAPLHDDPKQRLDAVLWRLAPGGLFDENAATIAQWDINYFIKPLKDSGLMELLKKSGELMTLIDRDRDDIANHPDVLLAMLSLPAMPGVVQRVIYSQSVVNRAIAACALERYRIKHNAYPPSLEDAENPGEPRIPLDIISGKPMGYRPTPDGKYQLWCVGFSGQDNGGKRLLDQKAPENTRFSDPKYTGDWVWDFAGK
jgi:hypothetical protein